jgi:Ring finger domain
MMTSFGRAIDPSNTAVGIHLEKNEGLLQLNWPHQSIRVDQNLGIIEVNSDYCTVVIGRNDGTLRINGSYNRYLLLRKAGKSCKSTLIVGQMNFEITNGNQHEKVLNALIRDQNDKSGVENHLKLNRTLQRSNSHKNPFLDSEDEEPTLVSVNQIKNMPNMLTSQPDNLSRVASSSLKKTQTRHQIIPKVSRISNINKLLDFHSEQALRPPTRDHESASLNRRTRPQLDSGLIETAENSLIPIIDASQSNPGSAFQTFECGICLQDCIHQNEASKLQCAHHFHFECVSKWLLKSGDCPNCRTKTTELTRWKGGSAHHDAPTSQFNLAITSEPHLSN